MTRIFCNGEFCINTNSDFDAQRAIDHGFNELTAEEIAAAGMVGQETFVGPDTTRIEGGKIIFTPPVKPLAGAREEKHAELKRIMQARRNAIQVEFDGDMFDDNESAQENMVVLLNAFDLGAPAVQIRSATEVTHTFDKDTCQQLSLVMLQAVQALYAEYWELKNRLAACETIAEVEAIAWPEAGK